MLDAVSNIVRRNISARESEYIVYLFFQGTPPAAKDIPIVGLFSLIFIVQGLGILFATWRLSEKLVILLMRGSLPENYDTMSRKAYNLFASIHHGSRLLSLGFWGEARMKGAFIA